MTWSRGQRSQSPCREGGVSLTVTVRPGQVCDTGHVGPPVSPVAELSRRIYLPFKDLLLACRECWCRRPWWEGGRGEAGPSGRHGGSSGPLPSRNSEAGLPPAPECRQREGPSWGRGDTRSSLGGRPAEGVSSDGQGPVHGTNSGG